MADAHNVDKRSPRKPAGNCTGRLIPQKATVAVPRPPKRAFEMLEPCAVKTASTVLRGGRWQQCHPLTRYLPQTPRSSIHWWLISCGVADCDSTSTAIENLSGLPARRFQEIIPSCNTDLQQRIQR